MQLFSGTQYLKIDLANNFGLDKEDWDTRLAWVDQNHDQLEELLPKAEEPAMYYAALQALKAAEARQPSGYLISLDATASGMQILSLLAGCEKTARLCNVVSTGHREDAYTNLYRAMVERMGTIASIGRKDTKQAIMTAFFDSEAVPKQVFGSGDQLDVFYRTMAEDAPGAWELKEAFHAFWNPNAMSNDWVLPDGFHVHIKVMGKIKEKVAFLGGEYQVERYENRPTPEGRSLGANVTHSIDGMIVRELTRRCSYDPVKIHHLLGAVTSMSTSTTRPRDRKVQELWERAQRSGFLSARILDYLDDKNMGLVDAEAILRLVHTFPKTPFEVLSVHDCFRVLPNYGNDLRQQYNRILAEIAGSNLLSYVLSQILGTPILVNKFQDLSSQVLEAEYALS